MNELIRRRALMGKKGGGLPPEYQQVEFLQNPSQQYIDMGVYGSYDTEVGADVFSPLKVDVNMILGCVLGGDSVSFTLNMYHIAQSICRFGDTKYTGRIHQTQRTKYTINKNGVGVDGVMYAWESPATQFVTQGTLYLFAEQYTTAGTAGRYLASNSKIYKVYVKERGTLIRDFIPCYRKSDNKPGMYDLVSGTFFTNQGEGEFLVGSNV